MQSVYISDPYAPAEVNSQKQSSAFPPNFIHSLDATHMLLTALECRTQGLTFASVHDSYWTHPSSIDQMSTIIRDTFVALHSSDVLGRLLNEFRERYAGYKIPLASLGVSQAFKQLGVCDAAADIAARDILQNNSQKKAETISESVSVIEEEEEEPREKAVEGPPMVSEVSKEQAVELLKSSRAQARRGKGAVVAAPTKGKSAPGVSLEGKFVDLIELLPLVPVKGKFDVNKIKSSLYFFS